MTRQVGADSPQYPNLGSNSIVILSNKENNTLKSQLEQNLNKKINIKGKFSHDSLTFSLPYMTEISVVIRQWT